MYTLKKTYTNTFTNLQNRRREKDRHTIDCGYLWNFIFLSLERSRNGSRNLYTETRTTKLGIIILSWTSRIFLHVVCILRVAILPNFSHFILLNINA